MIETNPDEYRESLGFLADSFKILFENQLFEPGNTSQTLQKRQRIPYRVPGLMTPIHVMSDGSFLIHGALHSFKLCEC
jgi:hypothetical protein